MIARVATAALLIAVAVPSHARQTVHGGVIPVPDDFAIVHDCPSTGIDGFTSEIVADINAYARTRWTSPPAFEVKLFASESGRFARTVTRLKGDQGILVPCGAFQVVTLKGAYIGVIAHEAGHIFLNHNERRRQFLRARPRDEKGQRKTRAAFDQELELEAEAFIRDFWTWSRTHRVAVAEELPEYIFLLEDQQASYAGATARGERENEYRSQSLEQRLRFWGAVGRL